ncbi:hypothetical protein SPW_7331 [Streptomyces sp. W007]|nr:hypothetical protein SPW_7331 [Streptomyces sp. W007]
MFDFCPGDCNEPITAREILEGYGLPDGVADEALMAHAHELAEKIRKDADEWDGWPEKQMAMWYAADLIDLDVP